MKKNDLSIRSLAVVVCAMMMLVLFGCNTTGEKTMKANAGQAEAVSKIKAMMASGKAYTNEDLIPHYDQLDPIGLDFMLGTWKGGKFDGGKMPDPINWYGKRFNSPDDVEPLLARKADGTVYSFDKWGMAFMREIKFRGKVSASLVYNKKPIMDYFRKVDENTLIGWGEVKGTPSFFFYLERQKDEG